MYLLNDHYFAVWFDVGTPGVFMLVVTTSAMIALPSNLLPGPAITLMPLNPNW